MDETRGVFLSALFRLRSLAILAAGVGVTVFFYQYFLFFLCLTAGTYMASVVASLKDPGFRRQVAADRNEALAALLPGKPDRAVLEHFGGPRGPYALSFQKALAIEEGIKEELGRGGAMVRRYLGPVEPKLDSLVEGLHELTKTGARVTKLLEEQSPEDVKKDLEGLEAKIATCEDDELRVEYEATRASKERLLASSRDLAKEKEKIDAKVDRTVSALLEMQGEVLRLLNVESDALEGEGERLDRQVEGLTDEVRLLKASLDEVYDGNAQTSVDERRLLPADTKPEGG